jgi:hypothetical protein
MLLFCISSFAYQRFSGFSVLCSLIALKNFEALDLAGAPVLISDHPITRFPDHPISCFILKAHAE